MYSPTDYIDEAVRAWWNYIEDAPLSYTCRQMNRSEDLIRRFYAIARVICAWDAERRQSKYVFGHRGPLTTTFEADESRFGKFCRLEGGKALYYSYVIIGIIVRGDPCSLWLEEYGVTHIEERDRVSPASPDVWVDICNRLFDRDTNGILMTDGAVCYKPGHPGIKQHHVVCHSEREWSRPVSAVLSNVDTGETVHGMAGTMLLDSTWGRC